MTTSTFYLLLLFQLQFQNRQLRKYLLLADVLVFPCQSQSPRKYQQIMISSLKTEREFIVMMKMTTILLLLPQKLVLNLNLTLNFRLFRRSLLSLRNLENLL